MRVIKMQALRKFNRINEGQEFTATRAEAKLFIKLGYAKIVIEVEPLPIESAVITRDYIVEARRRGRPARSTQEAE